MMACTYSRVSVKGIDSDELLLVAIIALAQPFIDALRTGVVGALSLTLHRLKRYALQADGSRRRITTIMSIAITSAAYAAVSTQPAVQPKAATQQPASQSASAKVQPAPVDTVQISTAA